MNILILSERSFPRHPGGAGKSTHVLATELVRRNHRVSILCECVEPNEVETIDGVIVHRLNTDSVLAAGKDREALVAEFYLRYIEGAFDPASIDLIYDSGGFLSFFFLVARALKQKYGTPYLIHYRYLVYHHRSCHEANAARPLSSSFLGMDVNLWETSQCFPARFADLVVCPSRFQAEFVEQHYRPVSGVVKVLPEPVDVSLPDPAAVRALRAEIAPPDVRLVFFGGRIDSELKNPQLVIEAFAKILQQEPRARLVLMIKTAGVLKAFKRIEKQVIALPWIADRARLVQVLAAMDVGLVPSSYESFGLMCAELLAVGTPVVASPVGAMRDMIEDGKNGFLLSCVQRSNWAEELASRTLALFGDPRLGSDVRDAARLSVANYSIERVGSAAEELCELAIRRTSGAEVAIRPPRFSAHDEGRYLRLLKDRLGPGAGEPAATVIAEWPSTAAERCGRCTRNSLARSQLAVVHSGPLKRAWLTLTGAWQESVRHKVEDVCPLGLVQRDLLRREE